MRRDVLRTIGGIVVVGLVVVATFLYGNRQSQQQMQKAQQLAAKVEHPTAAAPAKLATPTKPAPLPAQPQTQPTAIPQTGAGLWPVLASLGLVLAGRLYLQSRRDFQAARLGAASSLYKRPRSA